MILVAIKGGLGNQLFQYAFAKSLQLKNKIPVSLDISWFTSQSLRNLNLIDFNITLPIYNEEIRTSDSFLRLNIQNKIPSNLKYFKVIKETDIFKFNNKYLHPKDWSLIDGYFANTSYFSDINVELISDLKLKEIRDEVVNLIAKFDNNTVAIHIRRSDYLDTKTNPNTFTILTFEYFKLAIQKIISILNNSELRFIVFSDDDNSAKELFTNIDYNIEYINELGNFSDIEQFYILSKCNNKIISNSTYSWWAAYLNNHTSQICIQPKNWYQNSEYQKAYSDRNILQSINSILI